MNTTPHVQAPLPPIQSIKPMASGSVPMHPIPNNIPSTDHHNHNHNRNMMATASATSSNAIHSAHNGINGHQQLQTLEMNTLNAAVNTLAMNHFSLTANLNTQSTQNNNANLSPRHSVDTNTRNKVHDGMESMDIHSVHPHSTTTPNRKSPVHSNSKPVHNAWSPRSSPRAESGSSKRRGTNTSRRDPPEEPVIGNVSSSDSGSDSDSDGDSDSSSDSGVMVSPKTRTRRRKASASSSSSSSSSSLSSSRSRSSSGKKTKKKALTGYNVFFGVRSREIPKSKSHENVPFADISRMIGAEWKELLPEDKEHWKSMALKLKKEWEEEKEQKEMEKEGEQREGKKKKKHKKKKRKKEKKRRSPKDRKRRSSEVDDEYERDSQNESASVQIEDSNMNNSNNSINEQEVVERSPKRRRIGMESTNSTIRNAMNLPLMNGPSQRFPMPQFHIDENAVKRNYSMLLEGMANEKPPMPPLQKGSPHRRR